MEHVALHSYGSIVSRKVFEEKKHKLKKKEKIKIQEKRMSYLKVLVWLVVFGTWRLGFAHEKKVKEKTQQKYLLWSCSTIHSLILTIWWIYLFFAFDIQEQPKADDGIPCLCSDNQILGKNFKAMFAFSGAYFIASLTKEWTELRADMKTHHLTTGFMILWAYMAGDDKNWLECIVFYGLFLETTTPLLNTLFWMGEKVKKHEKKEQSEKQQYHKQLQRERKILTFGTSLFAILFFFVRCVFPFWLLWKFAHFWFFFLKAKRDGIENQTGFIYLCLWAIFVLLQLYWYKKIATRCFHDLLKSEKP